MILYGLTTGTAQAFALPARDSLLNKVANGNIQKTVITAMLIQFICQLSGMSMGGLADLMTSFIMNEKIVKKISFDKICIKDFPVCGTPNEVFEHHKLDEISIFKRIKNLYEDKNW